MLRAENLDKMVRLRNAPSSAQHAVADAPKTRQALKEKTNIARPAYEDAEHLIKDAKPKRGRPKKVQQNSDELVMGGGLGQKDGSGDDSTIEVAAKPVKPNAKRGRPKKVQQSSDELALSGALNETDHATQPTSQAAMTTDELAKSDDVPPPTAKPNRRPPRTARKVVHNEAQNKVLEGLKQRMEATARGQKGKQPVATTASDAAQPSSDTLIAAKVAASKPDDVQVERSEFSLSPSPPPPGKLSVVKGPRSSIAQPGSVLRAQATPMIESSLLALKNFKRRPRQLSMLQMVQQRTASAAPSVAHTQVDSTAVEDPSVFDLDLSDGEEDDFAPEAEGTPIAKPSRKSTASARGSTRSKAALPQSNKSTRKRKSDDVEASLASVSVKSTKKRRSERVAEKEDDVIPAPVTQVPATQPPTDRDDTPEALVTSEVQVQDSFSTSTPPTEPPSPGEHTTGIEDKLLVPSTEREEDADDDAILNGTMAEPLSSSPPRGLQSIDDVLADPLTQVSPPAAKQPAKKSKSKPMLTATLQSLLPKRRQPLKPRHRKSEYDMESDSEDDDDAALDASHLDNDEDELGGRLRRQAKTAPKNTAAKRGRPSKTAASTTRKASKAPARKSSVAPGAKKSLKTYGRQAAASDKENDEYESPGEGEEGDFTLPDVSISMEEAATSKEIEAAKKKFAEVDEWDFEFESMSAENHRSSSPQWR